MSSLINPRIHICPVGFEIDRIIEPAKTLKAEYVYLLVHDNVSEDKSTKYAEEIQKRLKKMRVDSELVYVNRKHVSNIIKAVKEIILKKPKHVRALNLPTWRFVSWTLSSTL